MSLLVAGFTRYPQNVCDHSLSLLIVAVFEFNSVTVLGCVSCVSYELLFSCVSYVFIIGVEVNVVL